jgi:23S rRNA (guanine745-N1)-methyltransferase
MNILKADNLACPVDGVRLESRGKQLVCAHGHAFDIARQGYVNLLPVQHKRSKQPGDSKEMVAARVHFLNSGVYEPLAGKLAELAFAELAGDKAACLMDAGCGEGYYLDYLLHYLKDKGGAGDLSLVGLDISKAAIAEAAKRNKQITWIVGTNRQPPVAAGSVDIILCVFGFHSFEGFSKILKAGGKVILAEPGPDHLKELREIIYAAVRKSEPQALHDVEKTGFSLCDSHSLRFRTGPIDHEQINNLLLMTPHFFRATKQGREAAGNLQQLDLTVDVVFRVLEKTSAWRL